MHLQWTRLANIWSKITWFIFLITKKIWHMFSYRCFKMMCTESYRETYLFINDVVTLHVGRSSSTFLVQKTRFELANVFYDSSVPCVSASSGGRFGDRNVSCISSMDKSFYRTYNISNIILSKICDFYKFVMIKHGLYESSK
jgi:hypothetical protein